MRHQSTHPLNLALSVEDTVYNLDLQGVNKSVKLGYLEGLGKESQSNSIPIGLGNPYCFDEFEKLSG